MEIPKVFFEDDDQLASIDPSQIFDTKDPDCEPFPTKRDPSVFPYLSEDDLELLHSNRNIYQNIAFSTPDGSVVPIIRPWDDEITLHYSPELENTKYGVNKYKPLAPFMHTNLKGNVSIVEKRKQWPIFIDFEGPLNDNQKNWITRASSNRIRTDERTFGEHLRIREKKAGGRCLADVLQKRMGDKAWFFLSTGGNPKAMMLMEYSEPVEKPKLEHALEIIKQYLPEYYAAPGVLGKGVSDIFTAFITANQIREAQYCIRRLRPIKVIPNGDTCIIWEEPQSDDEFYNEMLMPEPPEAPPLPDIPPENRPEFFYKVDITVDPILERNLSLNEDYSLILRCIQAQQGLLREKGYGLSQLAIARSTGLPQQTVSRILKRALADGLLKVIDSTYCPEKKAKTYRASGWLLSALIAKCKGSYCEPPTSIPNGEWHETLKATLLKCFKYKAQDFIPWVKTLMGYRVGDRQYQAKRLLKWFSDEFPHLAPA